MPRYRRRIFRRIRRQSPTLISGNTRVGHPGSSISSKPHAIFGDPTVIDCIGSILKDTLWLHTSKFLGAFVPNHFLRSSSQAINQSYLGCHEAQNTFVRRTPRSNGGGLTIRHAVALGGIAMSRHARRRTCQFEIDSGHACPKL